MDISQIRLANLLTLVSRFRTDREFCELVKISNTYLPQVKAGTKKIGDTLARRVEDALGLEYGWMDRARAEGTVTPSNKDPTLDALASLPAPLQDQIRRTLFMIAAFCHDETDIQPFRITDRNHHDQENDVVRSNNGS